MKVSLISTVYNEEGSVKELIESVLNQTQRPDEFIITDAGSTDGTIDILKKYEKEQDFIHIYIEEGCNISEGRNNSIENSDHDSIITVDGGCIMDERYIEAMKNGFEEGYDALSGLWEPLSNNTFEFVQGELRGSHIKPEKVPDNWAPSARASGFKKQVWEDAGKYPENLYTGEDSRFNTEVRKAGYEWNVIRDARVYWKMRPDFRSYFKQFYQYGKGDAEAGNILDYPGKVLGVSKVLLRTATTMAILVGLVGMLFSPYSIILFFGGILPQLGLKIPALIASVREKGLITIPYWFILVMAASIAHFAGLIQGLITKTLDFKSISC